MANEILNWPQQSQFYAPGFQIGSEGENGEHLRDTTGWPYSIYRKGAQPGVTDVVICRSIQNLGDACIIANRLTLGEP